jgi:hypothetical protein
VVHHRHWPGHLLNLVNRRFQQDSGIWGFYITVEKLDGQPFGKNSGKAGRDCRLAGTPLAAGYGDSDHS